MPRIREYVSQSSAQAEIPGRRATVSDFSTAPENAGRGLIEGSALVMKAVEQQEVSDVDAKLAKARAEWTVNLQERAASTPPGDMNFAGKFNEDFTSYMSELGGGVQTAAGRKAFQAGATNLGAHFSERAGLYQIQSAGLKAKQDYSVTLDANRNTVLNDPTQFDNILKSMDSALDNPDGPYARMPAAARDELRVQTRKELALSTAQGVIRLDPELGLKKLKDGDWDAYLDADKKFALEKNAEVGIQGKRIEAERVERAREKAEQKAQEATGNAFVAKLITDPTSLSAKDIAQSNLKWEDKWRFNMMLETAIKPDAIKTDPAVAIDVWTRIHLPDGDPKKITREEDIESLFGKGLTMSDVNSFRGEVQGRRTDDGKIESDLKESMIKSARVALSGTNQLTGLRDPKGDEQFQKFLVQFLLEYSKQRQAGKTPQALLDPDSPDYLGKSIMRFKRPAAQMMRDLITENGSIAAPALGGSTAPTVTAPSD